MLSLRKLAVRSAGKHRFALYGAESLGSFLSSRAYQPGRGWPLNQGVLVEEGVPIVPPSCGPVFSGRRGKCGYIVLNNGKVYFAFADTHR